MLKARILVAEDEALVAAAVQGCLAALGHEVVGVVATGEEAERQAKSLDPDLVLMDIRLKGQVDGIEAARRIGLSVRRPVVYLTAYSDDETLLRARCTEPYGYIVKPFDEKTLKSVIEMTLYRAAAHAGLRRTGSRLTSILDAIGEAVIVTGVKGQVLFLNRAAQERCGCTEGQALGRLLSQVFRTETAGGEPALLPITPVLMEGRETELRGCTLIGCDGGSFPVDLHLAPLRSEAGIIAGVVVSFHPIPTS